MDEGKYPLEQLVWLAKRLNESVKQHGRAKRAAILKEFNITYTGINLNANMLAGIYSRHGGDQAGFIRKYKNRKLPQEGQPALSREEPPLEDDLQVEEGFERLTSRLKQLWPTEERAFIESPDFANEPEAKDKREVAHGLIKAALKGDPPPVGKHATRALYRRHGVSELLEHIGYTPRFAQLVEKVLDLARTVPL